MSDYRIIAPPTSDYKITEPAPTPLELEPSPMDRMLGREKTVPEVGSLRDTIERQRRGMPTANEILARTEKAQLIDAVSGLGSYDPDNTFEDANGRLSLFDVSRSNESTEKYAKFKEKYPKGDIIFVPTDSGTIELARASEKEPFRKLGLVGPIAATIASPQTLASVAAGIATGGASLPVSMLAQAGAGAASSALNNYIEYLRGYQETGLGPMSVEAGAEALLGAAGEPIARGLTGAMGKGKEAVITSFKELAEASGEIPVLRGQTGNPIKTTLFKYVSKFSPQAKLALREQRASIRGMLERETDFTPEQIAAFSDEQLANYLDLYGTDIVLSKVGVPSGATANVVGKELRNALNKWKQLGQAATDARYTEALGFGKNEYWDPSKLKAFADENLQPVVGRKVRTPDENGVLPMGDDAYGDVQLSRDLHPELKSILTAITQLDKPIALHKGFSGVQQLMALRTRVGNLLREDIPGVQEKQAAKLYELLTETIETPFSGNPAFVAKWAEANAEYKAYSDFLRFGEVKAALSEKPAEKVAEKFMKPGNLDFMKLLRTNLTADPSTAQAWDVLKRGFKEQFTTSTDKLATVNRALEKFSPEERALLMSKEEERTLRMAGFQAQQIQNGPIAKMLREFNTEGDRILQLASDGNAAEIKRLVTAAGGIDSDVAGGMRAGVFQNLLSRSEYIDENTGLKVVDPGKLSTAIGELRKSGRLNELFTPAHWRRFDNWEKVAAVVGKNADEGSSIQAGEVAGDIARAPFNPMNAGRLVLQLGFADTLGYLLSRPQNFDSVLQAGTNMDQKRRDRAVVNATWQVLQNLQRTYNERENLTPMQEAERTAAKIEESPGMWEYIRSIFGGSSEPPAPASVPTTVPVPTTGQQGSLQPARPPVNMTNNVQNMARAMPPQPPQVPAQQPQQGIAGSRYAALFPGDTLGAMAASGGIGSLRG